VPAFDDPLVIAGQGTVGIELLAAAPNLDVIVVPVGGGGLIAGIAVAVKAVAPNTHVIGVQTDGYPGMLHALGRGPVPTGGPTIAEGIAVVEPGLITRDIVRDLVDDIVIVSEQHIEEAIALCIEIEKTVLEGAGAAALAAVIQYPERFRGRTVGAIASGGNIDARLLASVLHRALARSGRLVRLEIDVPDRPGALAAVTAAIAEHGGSIVDVEHRRDVPGMPIRDTRLELVIETRDRDHADAMVRAVESAGFRAEIT